MQLQKRAISWFSPLKNRLSGSSTQTSNSREYRCVSGNWPREDVRTLDADLGAASFDRVTHGNPGLHVAALVPRDGCDRDFGSSVCGPRKGVNRSKTRQQVRARVVTTQVLNWVLRHLPRLQQPRRVPPVCSGTSL